MPRTAFQKRVRHKPEDMLALVVDVEAYPKFINFVSAVRILDPGKDIDGVKKFTADVGIQYKFLSEIFRSSVIIDEINQTLEIERAGHGGAVRQLSNAWKFHELSDGSTLIDFKLNVRLKAAALDFLIRQKFEKATNHLVDVFERRAAQMYPLVGDEVLDYRAEAKSLVG